MTTTKEDIIAQLQRDILPLPGFKISLQNAFIDTKLGVISNAFPNSSFPVGAIHEFVFSQSEDFAATGGFVGRILSSLIQNGNAVIWISSSAFVFPPALRALGIAPAKIIFIQLKKEKEILWAMEEALKCTGISAVIGDMQELSFTNSRRLQLAVEQSHVTGDPEDGMPGIGFPRWNVDLLKVRNGKPGNWQVK